MAAIVCGVWLAVLWNWETTRRNVTVDDIALYLVLLPLTVLGVLLGLRWAWQGAGPRRKAALAAAAAESSAEARAAGPSTTPPIEAQRDGTVQMLSAHVASIAGTRPEDVLAALGESAGRPGLDSELRDADGMAVMSARIEGLHLDAIAEELVPALADSRAGRAEWTAAVPDDHVVRALALLAEPLASALEGLRPWAVRLGAPDREATRPPRRGPPDAAVPMVRLLLGWPSDWTAFECSAATEWARRRITIHTDIPLDRFVIGAHAAASGEELWLRADQLLRELGREQRSDLVLITACHSDLSDAAVAALEQQQRLFSSLHRPKGLMAGEAAAALLLANADWPSDPAADVPPARLHRAAVLRRDKSIEAAGRISSQCLQDCVGQALTAARLAPADVPALVCDGDQHTARGAELFSATLALLPHLEPADDMRLVGIATGHTGIANTLLVVATAAERARLDDAPCLALCVGDAFMRLALVARPAQAPARLDSSAIA